MASEFGRFQQKIWIWKILHLWLIAPLRNLADELRKFVTASWLTLDLMTAVPVARLAMLLVLLVVMWFSWRLRLGRRWCSATPWWPCFLSIPGLRWLHLLLSRTIRRGLGSSFRTTPTLIHSNGLVSSTTSSRLCLKHASIHFGVSSLRLTLLQLLLLGTALILGRRWSTISFQRTEHIHSYLLRVVKLVLKFGL